MKIAARKQVVFPLLITLLAAIGIFGWWHFTKPQPWSDDRVSEGAIYSIASGVLHKEREIVVAGGFIHSDENGFNKVICCYDAKNGEILWENREAGYLDTAGLQIHVALDHNGDVFVTSHQPHQDQRNIATLEKRSGVNGTLIWTKNVTVIPKLLIGGYPVDHLILPPAIDPLGKIWVIEATAEKLRSRIRLCQFDGQNGSKVNESFLTEFDYLHLLPEIICLKTGGAVVFASGGSDKQTAFRFSAAGKLLHQFQLDFSTSGSDLLSLRRYVDEARKRILISNETWQNGYDKWGSSSVKTAAFCLESGNKQWESLIALQGEWGHHEGYLPELAAIQSNGDLEYRHESQNTTVKIDWRRWNLSYGIPLPAHTKEISKRLIMSHVSGTDGSVGKPRFENHRKNWFQVQAEDAGTSSQEIYRTDNRFSDLGRIRCRDARQWLPSVNQTDARKRKPCFRVIRTPSGRIILSRDPNDKSYGSKSSNWQVKAL